MGKNEEKFIIYTSFVENPRETAGISAYIAYKLPMNPTQISHCSGRQGSKKISVFRMASRVEWIF